MEGKETLEAVEAEAMISSAAAPPGPTGVSPSATRSPPCKLHRH